MDDASTVSGTAVISAADLEAALDASAAVGNGHIVSREVFSGEAPRPEKVIYQQGHIRVWLSGKTAESAMYL